MSESLTLAGFVLISMAVSSQTSLKLLFFIDLTGFGCR